MSRFDDFGRDLRYGVRLLLCRPQFAAVVLATLSIAIGATVTVFSIVDAWLVKPLNFPDADRLVIAFAAKPERVFRNAWSSAAARSHGVTRR